MQAELIVTLVAEALDHRVLDGPVHPLDLAVGPWSLVAGKRFERQGDTVIAEELERRRRNPGERVAREKSRRAVRRRRKAGAGCGLPRCCGPHFPLWSSGVEPPMSYVDVSRMNL
ncbi:hypothetical protein LB565_29015 [Mesorhizobium sp. CA14]|uniref:hypothetical protein n=1 Tax=Mesorhizobium sp. CA14 TaxID=2876642 RepID=UPI001CC9552E|nr:hypothetical protein [Mesorhizobium sp. CA14]MBZ9852027.1 hypothetical protein [Mesorhizobium sp. CA14]